MYVNSITMVITLTKDMTKEEIQKKLAEIKPRKIFDSTTHFVKTKLDEVPTKSKMKFEIANHFGKLKWDEDPIAYQRRLRDE